MHKLLRPKASATSGRKVRIHFGEQPRDLSVAIIYTVGITGVLIATAVHNLLAILIVVFPPGYVLMAAVYPRNKDIDWVARIALSFGLGISLVLLFELLLDLTQFGADIAHILVSTAIFAALVGLAARWRRMRLPATDRLAATFTFSARTWRERGFVGSVVAVALAAIIAINLGFLTYMLSTARPGETFTEFYILGPGGDASGYPTALNLSQPGSVIFGIANHEAARLNYTVRIDLVGVRIVHNATSGFNDTIEVNRTTWSTFAVTLADGQNWTHAYTFQIGGSGLWKVQFLLFKDSNPSSPYAEVHLYVRVS